MSTNTDIENNTNENAQNIENVENGEHEYAKIEIDPDTSIFIGNVAYEVTESEIIDIFRPEFGSDLEITMPNSEPKIKSNGHKPQSKHAIVKFPVQIDFDSIKAKYDLTVLKEREIHIKRAKTSSQLHKSFNYNTRGGSFRGFRGGRGGSTFRGGRGNFRGGRGGYFRGGRGGSFRNNNFSYPKKEKVPLDQLERSKNTLYVNNVPFTATKEELAEFFGTDERNITLPMKVGVNYISHRRYISKNINRGIAFVSFDELNDATDLDGINKKVEQFNGKTFKDRELAIDVAAEKPEEDQKEETENTEDLGEEHQSDHEKEE